MNNKERKNELLYLQTACSIILRDTKLPIEVMKTFKKYNNDLVQENINLLNYEIPKLMLIKTD